MMRRIGMIDVVRVVSRRQHVGRYLDCSPNPDRAFDPIEPIGAVGDDGIELAVLFIEAVGHEGIAKSAARRDVGKPMPLLFGYGQAIENLAVAQAGQQQHEQQQGRAYRWAPSVDGQAEGSGGYGLPFHKRIVYSSEIRRCDLDHFVCCWGRASEP